MTGPARSWVEQIERHARSGLDKSAAAADIARQGRIAEVLNTKLALLTIEPPMLPPRADLDRARREVTSASDGHWAAEGEQAIAGLRQGARPATGPEIVTPGGIGHIIMFLPSC